MTPAILYAAKSTEDIHGSIPTQLADARQLADREGFKVVDDFADEAASAFKGDRGPDLAAAMAEAERLADEHGEAALVVQHSDRLARGDGRQAKHLVEYALWALKADVRIISVQDPQTFGNGDLLYAVVTGQRNHEDSKRKGQATAAGQRRRFESGKRLGSPIPDGYRLDPVIGDDGKAVVSRDGRAVRECVLDPERASVWGRIFDLVEQGHIFGHVRETLNREGLRTGRGGPWTTRAIRRGVLNDWYAGRAHAYGEVIQNDHPALIEPDRWERIAATLGSDDPVRARTKAGGRPAKAEADEYLLRGIAACGHCGASLYTRRLAAGRHYICRAVREGHGSCDADYIPAEQVELAVLAHLDDFIVDVRGWLAEGAAQGASEREQFVKTLRTQRDQLRKLDVRAQRAHEQYGRLLDRGEDELSDAALKEAHRFESEAQHLTEALAAGDQRLAEWPVTPEVDALLDFYSELRDAIRGRLSGSQTVQDLNAALRTVLVEARLSYRDGHLSGRFRPRLSEDVAAGHVPRALELVVHPDRSTAHKTYNLSYTVLQRIGLIREEPNTTC